MSRKLIVVTRNASGLPLVGAPWSMGRPAT